MSSQHAHDGLCIPRITHALYRESVKFWFLCAYIQSSIMSVVSAFTNIPCWRNGDALGSTLWPVFWMLGSSPAGGIQKPTYILWRWNRRITCTYSGDLVMTLSLLNILKLYLSNARLSPPVNHEFCKDSVRIWSTTRMNTNVCPMGQKGTQHLAKKGVLRIRNYSTFQAMVFKENPFRLPWPIIYPCMHLFCYN